MQLERRSAGAIFLKESFLAVLQEQSRRAFPHFEWEHAEDLNVLFTRAPFEVCDHSCLRSWFKAQSVDKRRVRVRGELDAISSW